MAVGVFDGQLGFAHAAQAVDGLGEGGRLAGGEGRAELGQEGSPAGEVGVAEVGEVPDGGEGSDVFGLGLGLGGRGAGGDALDAAAKAMEGVLVLQPGAKVNPGEEFQKRRQVALVGAGGAGQQHGDDAEGALTGLANEGGAHFFVVPGADVAGSDKDGAGGGGLQRFFDGFLPGGTGDEAPPVQEGGQAALAESVGKGFDLWFVLAVVGEEDVVFVGHGGLLFVCVARNEFRYSADSGGWRVVLVGGHNSEFRIERIVVVGWLFSLVHGGWRLWKAALLRVQVSQ